MEERFYAGIGSRDTPGDVCCTMTLLAGQLEILGYTLRSGAAPGADTAFEKAALTKEIFLPWEAFNGHSSVLCHPSPEAYTVAEQLHPAWRLCGSKARLLHSRNAHQVLGKDLKTPVDFVLYWAVHRFGIKFPEGGTAMALRIASKNDIPFYLIGSDKCSDFLASLSISV